MNSTHSTHSRPKRSSHTREAANTHSVYDTATRFPAFATIPSAAGEDLFSQFWAPGLLDRLQAPLTRYRE
jgi:hypothetical protein